VASDRKIWDKVDLTRCTNKKATVIAMTVQLHSARHFILHDSPIPNDAIAPLARRLPTLRVLDLAGCSSEKADVLEALLERCVALEAIILTNCNFVTDSAIQSLVLRFPKLQGLKLNRCKRITDHSMEHIAPMAELRKLSLRKCASISDRGIRDLLAGVPRLQQLDVRGCRLNSSVASSLRRVPKVKADEAVRRPPSSSGEDGQSGDENPLFSNPLYKRAK